MARCTAPVNGHRTTAAAENCPACRGRSRGYGSHSSYAQSFSTSGGSGSYSSNIGSRGVSVRSASGRRPRWSRSGSSVLYTSSQVQALTPIRERVEERASMPDLRDVFLCHAWDDRKGVAKDLHDRLEALGVSVWFSEKDVVLGSTLLREIDKGLAKSRVGIVLVTPSFLRRIDGAGIAEKELSALLARDLLVPIVHNTTYDALRDVSPLLGSRSGLDASEETLDEIATKLAELVTVDDDLIAESQMA
ncbi:MAG TPA: TIR domain protein [Planctomycetaceae bacterium]|nr:TIR domain protein [Planctomycetaceae bacterium]